MTPPEAPRDARLLDLVAGSRNGVLTTQKRDGRPQLSNINYLFDRPAGEVRISVTADRAKARNLLRDPGRACTSRAPTSGPGPSSRATRP